MDHLPDALEAAIGPRPDDLDLPPLHRQARTRRLRRRATLATAALGLVAVAGIGVAAATGGGSTAKAQVTASEGGPAAPSTTSLTGAAEPCIGSGTIPKRETTSTPMAASSTTATATADPSTIDPQESLPFETTTTTALSASSDTDVSTDSVGPIEPVGPVDSAEPSVQSTPSCAPDEDTTTTTTAPTTTTVAQETSTTTFATTSTTSASATPPGRIVVAGTFSGEGPIVDPGRQGCAQMHHHLDAAVTLDDGSQWHLDEQYCGVNENWVWSGEGTFEFTDTAGNSLAGTFTSRADVPTQGQPYQMIITRGTGRFAAATGTCDVANNVRDTAPGRSRQYGSFTCDIGLGTN